MSVPSQQPRRPNGGPGKRAGCMIKNGLAATWHDQHNDGRDKNQPKTKIATQPYELKQI